MSGNTKLMVGLAATLAVGAGVLWVVVSWQRGSEPEPFVNSRRQKASVKPESVLRLRPLALPVTQAPQAPKVEAVKEPDAEKAEMVVRVPVGQVLATVNQIPVTVQDLVGVSADEPEPRMSPAEYESRLQRAIEMNLTFQAAQRAGMGLTAEQRQRLGEIWTRQAAQLAEMGEKYGTTRSTVTDGQLAFQERVTAALMLQQNLVEQATGAMPDPDPARQAAYEAARRELLSKWRSAANIQLAAPVQQP